MSNPYYDHTTYPAIGAAGSSRTARQEFDAIEAGFDKLPVLSGNGNKFVKVNAGGTALEASLVAMSDVATITGAANNDRLKYNGSAWVNEPGPAGALVGISDTQTLTNKTISGASNTLSNIGNGALTNSSVTIGSTAVALGTTVTTFAGLASVTSSAFVGPLNGAVGGGTPAAGAFTSLSASGAFSLSGDQVQVSEGGTGGATAAVARVNLLPALATNAGRVLAVNVGETDVEWLTVAGTGTVTSVAGAGTVNGLTLTGTVTTSGSLALGGTLSGVALATAVTGTLPVANGGSGATTLTGILKGNGTGAFTALTAPSGTIVGTSDAQTLTNKTLSGQTNVLSGAIVKSLQERLTISATAATGIVQFDVNTQSVLYYTTNASGNWTLNVRGDSGATLNSIMTTGDAVTIVFMATQGATAYYQSALTIDGSSVTPKWLNAETPSAGNSSGIDVYTLTIVKTGSAAFTVLATVVPYA